MGNQKLTGRMVALKKPLAVLRPVVDDTGNGRRVRIVALLTRKYLFDVRPMTLINPSS